MGTSLDPREIYLLECYSSLDYFGEMRDTWAEMVKHVETCLQAFMQNLPPRYRSKPLPEQPDVVWGERVLPNFRRTLQRLNDGFILFSHGDASGLAYAAGPRSDYKGQMDYWAGWMASEDEHRYYELLNKAACLANNIVLTEGAYWTPPLPLSHYDDPLYAINKPSHWPSYQINRSISVTSGGKTIKSGIYIPDVDNSCAQFLSSASTGAPLANVPAGFEDDVDPFTGMKTGENPIFSRVSCTWYFVEKIVRDPMETEPTDTAMAGLRVPAGEPCPEPGFYFTPAAAQSRRRFERDEVMPSLGSDFGVTIWQRDSDQS